jgi:hypothetical protein
MNDLPRPAGKESKIGRVSHIVAALCVLFAFSPSQNQEVRSATVPFVLDHNRMLVDAEIERGDGTFRKIRLWVDTGNPEFFMSESLARDLGIDLSQENRPQSGTFQSLEVPPPAGIRIGGMPVDFTGVVSKVMFQPRWLFDTMHNDANLPATVLKRYDVVFDYPAETLTIAKPGAEKPRGTRAPAIIHPETGIVQIDAAIEGENLSFALDNGASYSFTSEDFVARLIERHSEWPRCTGAVGCANIWGWWPDEAEWPVVRVPRIDWGPVPLTGVGLAGLPDFFPNGSSIGEWYSRKTARPVAGFLGPNAFKAYRVEIDYAGSAVYFEKKSETDLRDMDLVGLTIRLGPDSVYEVVGTARREGLAPVEGVEPGDRLVEVDGLPTRGATMGTVVDALRGKPGEIRVLGLEREAKRLSVEARVETYLEPDPRVEPPAGDSPACEEWLAAVSDYNDKVEAVLDGEPDQLMSTLKALIEAKRTGDIGKTKELEGVIKRGADAVSRITPPVELERYHKTIVDYYAALVQAADAALKENIEFRSPRTRTCYEALLKHYEALRTILIEKKCDQGDIDALTDTIIPGIERVLREEF